FAGQTRERVAQGVEHRRIERVALGGIVEGEDRQLVLALDGEDAAHRLFSSKLTRDSSPARTWTVRSTGARSGLTKVSVCAPSESGTLAIGVVPRRRPPSKTLAHGTVRRVSQP